MDENMVMEPAVCPDPCKHGVSYGCEECAKGTLKLGEFHPMAPAAMAYVKWIFTNRKGMGLVEAISSTALSGNRTSEICHETLRRIKAGEPVSDRYLLGLAWFLRDQMEEWDGKD